MIRSYLPVSTQELYSCALAEHKANQATLTVFPSYYTYFSHS